MLTSVEERTCGSSSDCYQSLLAPILDPELDLDKVDFHRLVQWIREVNGISPLPPTVCCLGLPIQG